jgi:hypothetical protein
MIEDYVAEERRQHLAAVQELYRQRYAAERAERRLMLLVGAVLFLGAVSYIAWVLR